MRSYIEAINDLETIQFDSVRGTLFYRDPEMIASPSRGSERAQDENY